MFKLKEHNTTVRAEIIGGLTTFFAMSYIIFVNPGMLSEAGMNPVGVAMATCISAAVGCILTAFLANVPFAQAPGMGLNAFFTYTCCFAMGYTWQQSLTIVLISGVIFLIVALSPLRKMLINAIPKNLKSAISAGIGLFITLIGLKNSGVINFNAGLPALGDITSGAVLLTIIGIIITAVFLAFKLKGALFLGIIATAVIGLVPTVLGSDFFGTFVVEGSIYDIKNLAGIADVAFKFDFGGLMSHGLLPLLTAIVSFTLVDCFDTVGTLIGTAGNAGMLDEKGELHNGDKALIADAVATCVGACLGTSTVTTFVESSSGIGAGAKTGLSSLVVAVLFILSIFIAPIFSVLAGNSWFLFGITSPALVIVGVLMMKGVKDIDWNDMEEAIPSFLTVAMMPFAYSISEGIAFGFISYTLIKVLKGKFKQVPVLLYILSVLFIVKYILAGL
ncbi:MAG: NCS2 family permease [Clostridia bacterium]|nr:NCS2 family permease [Clostridia bacterium]